jgi:hypothetical protein
MISIAVAEADLHWPRVRLPPAQKPGSLWEEVKRPSEPLSSNLRVNKYLRIDILSD